MKDAPDLPQGAIPRDPVAYPHYPMRPTAAARPIFSIEEEHLPQDEEDPA